MDIIHKEKLLEFGDVLLIEFWIRTINHEDTEAAQTILNPGCSNPFAHVTNNFHAQLPYYSKYIYNCNAFKVKLNAQPLHGLELLNISLLSCSVIHFLIDEFY